MLTAEDRSRIQSRARAAIRRPHLRNDAWWGQPVLAGVVLVAFLGYSVWAGLQNAAYYAHPYISPMYAPCIAANCEHVTFPIVGAWWRWSPALLILIFPLGFRATCYFYRRVAYRTFLAAPPACAVAEPAPNLRSRGESKAPFILMNIHRYFLYVAIVLAVLHFYDLILALHFHEGWGVGLGTLLMGVDTVLLAGYVVSCHSFRHFVGGHVDRFSEAPVRHRLWKLSTRLNPRHGPIAWASLTAVMLVDIYVRGLVHGWWTDPHVILF